MRKKTIIIIIILVLIISGYIAYSFTRKPQVNYTTMKVERGEVLQTVSATGAVEAATKLDLRFVNSGKIEKINVKVGDHIEKDMVLAKLDTTQLESQLNRANASLKAAQANYNKLIAGATAEDIKISETAVNNAQIALNAAEQSLIDMQIGATKDIANSEASVSNAEVALSNSNLSLSNALVSNANNLNQDYEDGWNAINSALLTASDSLNANKTVLEYEDAQGLLGVKNQQYLNNSNQSKSIAIVSYNNAKSYVDNIRLTLTDNEVDQALSKTKSMLKEIRDTLYDTSNILQATITSSDLSQEELNVLKSDISTARSSVNTAISNVTSAEQNIATQKVTNQTNLDSAQSAVNSAESALSLSKQSLASVKASAAAKINSAQNAIKSAEGALKQAQDQLTLKKAGPSLPEIALYKAQVQEAQANLDLIQNQIRDSSLIAPKAGIVTKINGEVGETATTASEFISIITAENFQIKANISEVDISKVKIGDEVEITFDALGPEKEFKGEVVEIDPAETEISGVVYYKVATIFTADSEIIKPGMTANLDIQTAHKENVLTIPFQAIKEKDGRKYVQVLEGGVAKDIIVEVGLKGDVDLEIINGLKEGQDVVTFAEN
jgi:multidrug efflux pump subunit AcrA (membrane-fusion protein)